MYHTQPLPHGCHLPGRSRLTPAAILQQHTFQFLDRSRSLILASITEIAMLVYALIVILTLSAASVILAPVIKPLFSPEDLAKMGVYHGYSHA